MSIENNLKLMERFVEFVDTANEQLAQELISSNATFYVPGQPEPMRGPEGYLAIIGMMRSDFLIFNGHWKIKLLRRIRLLHVSLLEEHTTEFSTACLQQKMQLRFRQ